MKIQTFSVVVGTRACNAKCPFCISKMTGFGELPKVRDLNVRNFDKACRLAEIGGATTVLLTGKGEPTLYPDEVSRVMSHLSLKDTFPFIELQTNGLLIGQLAEGRNAGKLTPDHLVSWHMNGLDTIALSIVSLDSQLNARVYMGNESAHYPDLARTVEYLHSHNYNVRLCVMLHEGYGTEELRQLLQWCREHEVEQLTIRPLRKPEKADFNSYSAVTYVDLYGMGKEEELDLYQWVREQGVLLRTLMHGAEVYDIQGQNICVSDCLTQRPEKEDIRTLIFYTDGRTTYDWQHKGAVFLGR